MYHSNTQMKIFYIEFYSCRLFEKFKDECIHSNSTDEDEYKDEDKDKDDTAEDSSLSMINSFTDTQFFTLMSLLLKSFQLKIHIISNVSDSK